ncbi:hypothetical protein R7D97_08995 [Vibrio sp. Vb5031]|uniref:hypothetical protein n=1 Tax=Vibrio TaxID=662 RepID=UPI0007204A36|nr:MULTISPECIES: hypothetical protein [Vibrio]ALR91757.1 hypothetical protein AT730_04865 [Vibrio alginolyticus]EJU9534718.1 hypothetical protein [Vibrio alginolyticus]ELA8351653.1 hypothetical protein [Vibrio alginolyticus]ELA8466712.1 hypothetical protein [Vibrio alginolyticus]MBS9975053.1 hypothetical protein [Vibrio alginolyticus]
MEISSEKIKGSIASFLAVFILFGGGWYYLDQQRLAAAQEQQEALKLKIEADLKLQQYDDQRKALEKKEQQLKEQYREQARDKELSDLTLKFIDEASGINFHQQCGDDPEHNAQARKAKALLSLIESKAIEYGRMEIVNNFVKKQRFGIGGWSQTCKP